MKVHAILLLAILLLTFTSLDGVEVKSQSSPADTILYHFREGCSAYQQYEEDSNLTALAEAITQFKNMRQSFERDKQHLSQKEFLEIRKSDGAARSTLEKLTREAYNRSLSILRDQRESSLDNVSLLGVGRDLLKQCLGTSEFVEKNPDMQADGYFWLGVVNYEFSRIQQPELNLPKAVDSFLRATLLYEKSHSIDDLRFFADYMLGWSLFRMSVLANDFDSLDSLEKAELYFARAEDSTAAFRRTHSDLQDYRKRKLGHLVQDATLANREMNLRLGIVNRGNLAEAEKYFKKSSTLSRESIGLMTERNKQLAYYERGKAQFELAKLYSGDGRDDEQTLRLFRRAKSDFGNVELEKLDFAFELPLAYDRAMCDLYLGIVADSSALLRDAEQRFNRIALPQNDVTWRSKGLLALGIIYLYKGQYYGPPNARHAITYFESANDLLTNYWRGWAYFLNHDFVASRQAFETFINSIQDVEEDWLVGLRKAARFQKVECYYFGGFAIAGQYEALRSNAEMAQYDSFIRDRIAENQLSLLDEADVSRLRVETILQAHDLNTDLDTILRIVENLLRRGIFTERSGLVRVAEALLSLYTNRDVSGRAKLLHSIALANQGHYPDAINGLNQIDLANNPAIADEVTYALGRIHYEYGRATLDENMYRAAQDSFALLSERGSRAATFFGAQADLNRERLDDAGLRFCRLVRRNDLWGREALAAIENHALPACNALTLLPKDSTKKIVANATYFLYDEIAYNKAIIASYKQRALESWFRYYDSRVNLPATDFLSETKYSKPEFWLTLFLRFPDNSHEIKDFVVRPEFSVRATKDGIELFRSGFPPNDTTITIEKAGYERHVVLFDGLKNRSDILEMHYAYNFSGPTVIDTGPSGEFAFQNTVHEGRSSFFVRRKEAELRKILPRKRKGKARRKIADTKILTIEGKSYMVDRFENRIIELGKDETIDFAKTDTTGKRLDKPAALTYINDGGTYYLIIADTYNNRIVKCNQAGECGEFVRVFHRFCSRDSLSFPINVFGDERAFVYVADFSHHRVLKFDSDGQLSPFGRSGNKMELGQRSRPGREEDGLFFFPTSVYVDDAYIYVSDLSGRIQKFDSQGNFIRVVARVEAPLNFVLLKKGDEEVTIYFERTSASSGTELRVIAGKR